MRIFTTLVLITSVTCINAVDQPTQRVYPRFDKISYTHCPSTRTETLSATLYDYCLVVSRFENAYLGHFCTTSSPFIGNLEEEAKDYFDALRSQQRQQEQETKNLALRALMLQRLDQERQQELKMLIGHKTTIIATKKRRQRKKCLLSYSKTF